MALANDHPNPSQGGVTDGSRKLLCVSLQNDLERHRVIEAFPVLVAKVRRSLGGTRVTLTGYVSNDSLLQLIEGHGQPSWESPQCGLRRRVQKGSPAWTMVVSASGKNAGDALRELEREVRHFGRTRIISNAAPSLLFDSVPQLRQEAAPPSTKSILAALRGAGIRTSNVRGTLPVPEQNTIPVASNCAWVAFRTPLAREPAPRAWEGHVATGIGLIEGASSVFQELRAPFLCLTVIDAQSGLVDLIGTHRGGREVLCFDRIATLARDLLDAQRARDRPR